jgi:hypothetical protein
LVVSGADGRADLYTFYGGCPDVWIQIRPEAPAGYELITELPTVSNREVRKTFSFGFVPIE